ncbi:hypothetical protein Bca101_036313 [Brassica carinata]
MVIDHWTANPPDDFLQYMELWIRIRHIPVNLFTTNTMYALDKEVGKVEEIAYDPKVSHTKDYIRAKILFNVDNPAKAFRRLEVSKESTVTIEFEYEKIHKRCFHCLRLTHEKLHCPLLKKGAQKVKIFLQTSRNVNDAPVSTNLLEGKLGSSVFEQGIEEKRTKSSICLTKITKELDKGKGHVFSYHDPTSDKFRISGYTQISHPKLSLRDKEEDDTESSASHFSASSEPVLPTGFRLGPSSGGRVSGIQGMSKAGRRRPSSWKRKAFLKASVPVIDTSSMLISKDGNAKRKPSTLVLPENKSLKVSNSTVASVLKPLPPQ